MKKEIIKSFDLEAYKKGVNVKTRDGHEVRIVCTDAKGSCFPLIALIKIDDAHEVTMHYTYEGKIDAGDISDNDLVIVEEVEEPEFWTDKEDRTADGYFIDSDSSIAYCPYAYYNRDYYKNFADRKQAISAKAMARISQIMANDIEHFERQKRNYTEGGDGKKAMQEFIDWLKSLRPQSTWKPSDEQMDALQYVCRNLNPPLSDKLGWDSLKTLELLYKILKKLK